MSASAQLLRHVRRHAGGHPPSVGAAGLALCLGLAAVHVSSASAECEKVKLENYPIGTLGKAWGDAEKQRWRESRVRSDERSYESNVLGSIWEMGHTSAFEGFHPVVYGTLESGDGSRGYPMLAFVPHAFKPRGKPQHQAQCGIRHYHDGDVTNTEMEEARSKPTVLITGGTHGYETSGIMGALRFVSSGKAKHYAQYFNIVVVPCLSPWSYERNERWVATADDPNRSFGLATGDRPSSEVMRTEESTKLLEFLDGLGFNQSYSMDKGDNVWHRPKWLCHIDLHETTDSDVKEFRPAKAARDGLTEYDDHVPDGFYLVGDSCDIHGNKVMDEDRLGFYHAILKGVEGVTHIAEMQSDGTLSGYPAASRGLLLVPCKELGLCGGGAVQDAPYVATTEVYPDSDQTTEEECINAQVEAICAGLDYLLKKGATLIPIKRSERSQQSTV